MQLFKKKIKYFRSPLFHASFPQPCLLVFTLYCLLNCLFVRFKINKLLIFVVWLAFFFIYFFYYNQIGLLLGLLLLLLLLLLYFFFFLFKNSKINVGVELVCCLASFRRFKFLFRMLITKKL